MEKERIVPQANNKSLRKLNRFCFNLVRDEKILKGITFCSIRYQNGCKRLEEITKYKIPDADTVYTRLSKKNFKKNFRWILFYGENNPFVGTNNFDGTKLCFKYTTINTVIGDQRICLFALPVTPLSRNY